MRLFISQDKERVVFQIIRNFLYFSKFLVFQIIFLFFCIQANAQWEKLDKLYGESISGLASNGHSLFAAGSYLYTSSDLGQSWNRLLTLPESPAKVLYGYPGYLFAGTFRHLYRTNSDGLTWTSMVLPDSVFNVVSICRVQETLLVHVSTPSGYKVYLSEDNGDYWQLPETPIPFNRISGLHEINGMAYACTVWGIYRSFDKGHHWELFSDNLPTLVDYDNPMVYANGRFIVATRWGIYTSPDGAVWESVLMDMTPACMMALDSIGNSNQKILLGTSGSGILQGLYSSQNSGTDWNSLPEFNIRNANVTCILKTNFGLFAGTAGDGVLRSLDTGQSWQVTNTGMSERLINKIAADDHTLIASDGNKQTALFVSTDHGATWKFDGLNLVSAYPHVHDIMVQDDRLWVATQKGLFSKKMADTAWTVHWQDSVFRFLAKSGQTIYAATYFSLLKTANAGQTWTNCVWRNGFNEIVQGISANENAVIILSDGYLTRSTDGGDHFASISFPNQGNTIRILTNDGTDFYVCSAGKGVYRSENNGTDWELVNNSVNYEISDIAANATCMTTASGIFGLMRSTDKGQTWSKYNEGFTDNTWEAWDLALSGDTLFMAGAYRWVPGTGIWKRSAFPAGLPTQPYVTSRLVILPNPATDKMYISAEKEVFQNTLFTIMDIRGQVVKSGTSGVDGSINVSDLCSGEYLIVESYRSKKYLGQFIKR